MSKIRNIIIFVSIGAVLVLVYFFFIKGKTGTPELSTSTPVASLPGAGSTTSTPATSPNDLTASVPILLNIQNIKLEDSIFASPAFNSLHDSTTPISHEKSDEGRPNPFAPLGSDTLPAESLLPTDASKPAPTLPGSTVPPKN